MIDGNGMYNTEALSHLDRLALACPGCGHCFVRLEKRREGRYQCFERLYMHCDQVEVHVERDGRNLVCSGFCGKKSDDGRWR